MSLQTETGKRTGRLTRMKMADTAARSTRPARPVPLSDRERRLLDLLPKTGKKITSTALVKRYYAGEITPLNARQIVVSRMNSVKQKLITNKDKRRVMQSKRRGPKPINYWLETLSS